MDVLLLCTANQCRSPMAEGLLRERLTGRGGDVTVHSAGLYPGGVPATDAAVRTLAGRGVDIAAHRSRTVTADLVAGADLVVGMTRAHVREAVILVPNSFGRCFTLKELVRRGEAVGPRRAGEAVADWLARLHAGRTTADLIGVDPADDVADPIGRPDEVYAATADELDALLGRLADLLLPAPAYVVREDS